jgi:hypothetical protein
VKYVPQYGIVDEIKAGRERIRICTNSQTHPAKSSGELRYPFPALPEPGQMIEVAPGVRWQRMPLPTGAILQMATGESVAHLNCLIHRGLAEVRDGRRRRELVSRDLIRMTGAQRRVRAAGYFIVPTNRATRFDSGQSKPSGKRVLVH